jgi:hypothetical protein
VCAVAPKASTSWAAVEVMVAVLMGFSADGK